MLAYYLSHPEVRIDPSMPVTQWQLSDIGRARVEAVRGRPWLRDVERVIASSEVKARETAEMLAAQLGLVAETGDEMHENDRSATGYLPPSLFEVTADAFFARPDETVDGWERAVDAQARIVGVVSATLARARCPTLFVGHGGVGTLLACHIRRVPISRRHDQARVGGHPGGGNVHAFSPDLDHAAFGWTPMEQL